VSQERLNKEILSIDHDDDEKVSYEPFADFLADHTNRIKKRESNDIAEMGESLLSEIDHKQSIKNITKEKQIDYIVKNSSKYSYEYLLELDYRDVDDIFSETKEENKSFWVKLGEFFNLTHH